MRAATRELLSFFLVLIMAFLLLTHATGFARDVTALGSVTSGVTKTLQGR